MPLTPKEQQMLDLATKVILGYGHTDITKRVMEEREAFDTNLALQSRSIFHPTEIWGEALPGAAPTTDTSEVEVYQQYPAGGSAQGIWRLTPNTTTANPMMSWLATLDATPPYWGDDQDPRLQNWIPEKYLAAWPTVANRKIHIYEDKDGTGNNGPDFTKEILPSDAVGWLFDHQAGILTFETDPTVGPYNKLSPFWVQGYRYIGDTLQDVLDNIVTGASITVEDSVPTPFPNTNNIRFGSNFAVTTLGTGHVQVSLATSTTWPWPNYSVLAIVGNGSVGVPKDLALSPAVSAGGQNERAFVYMNGAKLTYGATKDYIFTSGSTLRLQNNAGRMITMDGMEIVIYYE